MELRHLRYFTVAGEEEHFGRAADRLHIVQPALTKQIKQLEDELGIYLFERLKRGVRLTLAGRSFLEDARRILGSVEAAIEQTKQVAQGKIGQLRIGFVDSTMLGGEAPLILNEFRDRFPHVRLSLKADTSVNCGTFLKDKTINLGIVHWLPSDLAELRFHRIGEERLLLAVPRTHPFSQRRTLKLKDLRDVPFVWFSRDVSPMYYDRVFDACRRAGVIPKVIQEANSIPTMLGLVAAGMGVCFVYKSTEHWRPDNVAIVGITDSRLSVNVYVIWRRDDSSPSLRHFLDVVARHTL